MEENFREECRTMPDDELREIYKKKMRIQKRLSAITWIPLIPAGLIYGIMGWSGFFVSEYSQFQSYTDGGSSNFLFFALFALCGALLMSRSEKSFYFIPWVMVVGIIIKVLIWGGFGTICVVMLAYVIIACIVLKFVVADLNFLRSLPNFPFEKRRNERNF